MNRYLIINLRRNGDILSSARLINSIIVNDNKSNVDILAYKEFKNAAKCLRQVDKFYFIDRKKILTLKKSSLFSDGFAINYFHKFMNEVKKNNFYKIINMSNDHVSAYMTSYLSENKKKYHGIRFSKNNTIESSNQWAMLFNEVLTEYQHTPIHYIDCYHKILEIPLKRGVKLLKSKSDHEEMASKNFSIIRKNISTSDIEKKIIGIQLKSSVRKKEISKEVLIATLKRLLESKKYFPVILIAPIEKERQYIKEINAHFDDSLVTVEADFLAVISVIKNLDLLLTPDTVVKHIADLINIPILEISLGNAPFLKQGIYNTKGIVLTDSLKKRIFKSNRKTSSQSNITDRDIIECIDYMFTEMKANLNLSTDVALYKTTQDALGVRYDLITGSYDPALEITRLMSRYYISVIMDVSNTFPREILRFSADSINKWVYDQKDHVNNATRNLLNTLRSLLSIKENLYKIQKFVWDLDKLLAYCNSSSIVAIPTLLFSAGIESISDTTNIKNIKNIERLIYKLKEHYQTAIICIKHLEKNCFDNHIKISREKLVESRKRGKRDGQLQI
ncbi:MAG: hypothetical protein OXB84_02055 [Halobacteriovoraceae bacterium]|nr:hypothetical protein [Halobacteriovoraceae bacterium]